MKVEQARVAMAEGRSETIANFHTDSPWIEYGQLYVLDFPVQGPRGEAMVRSGWIIRQGEDFPRLTSCYVL